MTGMLNGMLKSVNAATSRPGGMPTTLPGGNAGHYPSRHPGAGLARLPAGRPTAVK